MASWSRVSALAFCFVAASCGGESLAHRAQAVCSRDADSPPRELADLRALHEPALQPLVAALARAVDDARWLHIAAVSGDSEMGMSAENLGRRALAQARAEARKIGAPACV
jgi:hypothetical protein